MVIPLMGLRAPVLPVSLLLLACVVIKQSSDGVCATLLAESHGRNVQFKGSLPLDSQVLPCLVTHVLS